MSIYAKYLIILLTLSLCNSLTPQKIQSSASLIYSFIIAKQYQILEEMKLAL